MLDTNARKYVQPMFEGFAKLFIKAGLSANQVTVIAFIVGMSVGVWVLTGNILVGLIMLWISGILDAVDGTVARLTKTSSNWGTLLDLVFDRLVEMGMIVALATVFTDQQIYFIYLMCSILFSMCVFLSVAAMTPKDGVKTFRYQAGVMERSEGFVCFSLMLLFPQYLTTIVVITTFLITFTALQRINEARVLLKS